jgi:uncharacterized protein with gpF-like domain
MAAASKTLPAIRPNVGLEARYRRRLEALIDEMNKSFQRFLLAAYREHPPEMAADRAPAVSLHEAVRRLADRWQKRFDAAGPALARFFAQSAYRRSDASFKSILKRHGLSVELKLTPAVNDTLQASIAEQVGLIKSIPQQYLSQVQGLVMRSVQEGRNAAYLADELVKRYDITRRRAAFIARDQSNKATATINRVRQQELGITEAIWVHSGGGNHPRPTHVQASRDKVRYDVREGWLDPAVKQRIWPGVLPNCRCVSKSILPTAMAA